MRTSHLSSRPFLRPHIITILVLCVVLSACTYTNPFAAQTAGPIQLYDVHGVFLCQIHGQNPQTDCLAQNTTIRQVAMIFITNAVNELAGDLHVQTNNLPSSSLKVATTLDLALQKQVLQNTTQYITTMTNTHHMTNAASVTLDYHNGAIRSLIGSLDDRVNVVTQKVRQVGPTIKPFVYTTSFEQGISPGEVVYDGPFSVSLGQGTPPYSPFNNDGKFHGYMSYRAALQNNLNIPVLKLYIKTGSDALKKKVIAMGIKPEETNTFSNYSTPFGPMELPLLDITAGYGTMANGGLHVPPHEIEKISDSDNHIIYEAQPHGTQALSPQSAFMITDVMSDMKSRISASGQCNPSLLYATTEEQCQAGNPGTLRPAAVYGGLTNTFKDTTVIGYTTDLVVGAWTGNSDDTSMFNITGQDGAAHIWHNTMLLAEGQKPITPFPGPPAGVIQKTVSYPNLTTTDWYSAQ